MIKGDVDGVHVRIIRGVPISNSNPDKCVVRIFLSSSTASQICLLDLPIHGLLIEDYPEHPILNKRDGIEIAVCTGISI